MKYLKNKTLANISPADHIDYTLLWQFVIATCGIVTSVIYTVNKYFTDKAKNNQKFIESVVKATIESSLSSYQNEFKEFKKEMQVEVAHFNRTVINIYDEMRKG